MQLATHANTDTLPPLFLLIEANNQDADILEIRLRDAYQHHHAVLAVDSVQAASEALTDFEFDALIYCSSTENLNTTDTVKAFCELTPSLPIVVITDDNDFSLANQIIASGAEDYLHKNELTAEALLRSLAFATQRKKAQTSHLLHSHSSLGADSIHDITTNQNPLQQDSLTEIHNLSYFYNYATTAIFRAQRANAQLAVLLFDINDFELINQQFGRHTGDQLLQLVAKRCENIVRHTECIARLYDDTFAIITDTLNHEHEAYPLVTRLQQCFDSPFETSQKQIVATPSIGVAFLPQAADLNDWVKQADAAKTQAKASAKTNVEFASESASAGYKRTQSVAAKIEKGLQGREFSTVFQSYYCDDDSNPLYAEAFSRWRSTSLGNVAPREFLPALSQNSMLDELTKQVLANVAQLQEQALAANRPIGKFSVNISTAQLHDRIFCENFLHWLSVNDLSSDTICLEISERESINAILACKSNIHFLHQQGISFALDNFGTGNTAMTQLADLPIDYLKIDRAITQNIDTNKPMQALSSSVIKMAHKLGIKVVAEGIETQEEFYVLRAFDCDFYQGFYFGQPCNSHTLMQEQTVDMRAH